MQEDEPSEWLSFQLAADEVERRFGLTRRGAEYAVVDAIESGKLKWRRVQAGPDVLYADLRRWLDPPTINATISISVARPKSTWQQLRVMRYLREMYPNGVPDRRPENDCCPNWPNVIQPLRGWTGRRCDAPLNNTICPSLASIDGNKS